jgi:integrase
LLEEIQLGKEVVEIKEALSPADREKIMAACDGSGFEQVRDRAFVQLLLATACRFKEIYGLTTDTVDLDTKRMWVVLKGGRNVPVDVDGKALRDLRVYMGRRRLVAPPSESSLWLSDSGKPLTYWGAYGIFNRLTERTGVKCNPHRFRHTLAQVMASGGAPIADIQDALHHTSDRMSRRYIGNARQEVAAGLAKKWSLAG